MTAGPDGTLVLFGGSVGEYPSHTLLADTWVWDDGGWRLAAPSGPAAHSSVSMAYDSARAQVVLFGGWTDGGDLAATWTWNGTTWTRHDVFGPGARSSAAMSWDPWSERVVLFGGCGDDDPGDTWAWDGARWEQHHVEGPGNRCRATLAPLARLGGLVLFGGVEGRGPGATRPVDLWLWRDETWTRLDGDGPAPEGRANHSMVHDPVTDELVVFGGTPADRRVRDDLWRFDGRRWHRESAAAGPGAREVAAMAWDEAAGRMLLHGGRDPQRASLGDTWILSDGEWTPGPESADPADRAVPAGRGAAAGGWDPSGDRLLVFGGIGGEPAAFGDLWSWNRRVWREIPVSEGPSPRFNSAGAFLEGRRQFVMHGGGNIDEQTAETWVFQDGTWHEIAGDGPGPLECARMVGRPDMEDAILYGGMAGGHASQETWRWDGSSWSLLARKGPPGTCFHAMAYDEARRQIVHFGGRGGERSRATWVFEDDTWRQVTTEGPAARDHHAMAYDRASRTVVLVGGGGQEEDGSWDGSVLDDTWGWDGRGWSRFDEAGAPARFHAPVVVGTDNGVLMFGGSDRSSSYADIWEWNAGRWRQVSPQTRGAEQKGTG